MTSLAGTVVHDLSFIPAIHTYTQRYIIRIIYTVTQEHRSTSFEQTVCHILWPIISIHVASGLATGGNLGHGRSLDFQRLEECLGGEWGWGWSCILLQNAFVRCRFVYVYLVSGSSASRSHFGNREWWSDLSYIDSLCPRPPYTFKPWLRRCTV